MPLRSPTNGPRSLVPCARPNEEQSARVGSFPVSIETTTKITSAPRRLNLWKRDVDAGVVVRRH